MTDETRECPMCGESMRRQDRMVTIHIPGTNQVKQYPVSEWVCRECDYFEESGLIEEDGDAKR